MHGSTRLNEWSARRSGRYLHDTQKTQETNFHARSDIRTPDSSSQAPADLDRMATGIGRIELSIFTLSKFEPSVFRINTRILNMHRSCMYFTESYFYKLLECVF